MREREIERLNRLKEFEKKLYEDGVKYIAGIDEAGRGPLAGPVVCAAVIMPLDDESIIVGVDDSKKLSDKKREQLYNIIRENCHFCKLGAYWIFGKYGVSLDCVKITSTI